MVPAIIVRAATPQDAPSISVLNAEVQQLHYEAHPEVFKPPDETNFSPSAIRELMQSPANFFWLAEIDGQPAGYLYAATAHLEENPIRYAFDRLHIHQIGVLAQFQGFGCGKRLIQAARQTAEELGMAVIMLNTWAFNHQAQSFFGSQGFEIYNLRYWLWLNKDR